MADFEAKVRNAQQRLGRPLNAQELQLLRLWDADPQALPTDVSATPKDGDEPAHEPEPMDFDSGTTATVPSTKTKVVLLTIVVLVVFVVWFFYARGT